MDYRIFVEPQQGTTYERLLALARRAEELGFDGFFTSDHYLRMGDSAKHLLPPVHRNQFDAGISRM